MGSAAENFDAFFKNRLEHVEVPPDDKAWENIAERLGHKRRRRMVAFFIRIAAGMALIISLSIGYYFYTHHRTINVPSLTNRANEDKTTGMHHNGISNNLNPVTGHDNISGKSDKSDANLRVEKIRNQSSENVSVVQSFKPAKKEIFNDNNHEAERLVIVEHKDKGKQTDRKKFADTKLHQIAPVEAHIAQIKKDNIITISQAKPGSQLSETDMIALQNLEDLKAMDEEEKQKEKWMLGGQVAPLYTYRMLSSDQVSNSDINILNENEKGVFAYAGGICFAYLASNRLSVQTGVQYSKYGQEKVAQINVVNSNYQYFENGKVFKLGGEQVYQVTIRNSTGTISSSTSQNKYGYASSISNNDLLNTNYLDFPAAEKEPQYGNIENLPVYQYFDFLEIPLILKYKIIDSRINLNLSGGLNANILVGNKVIIENDNRDIYRKTTNINKVNYSSLAGLGIEYSLNTNLFLNFEPRFIYYLNNINENVGVNVHPYSFGAFAGISYLF